MAAAAAALALAVFFLWRTRSQANMAMRKMAPAPPMAIPAIAPVDSDEPPLLALLFVVLSLLFVFVLEFEPVAVGPPATLVAITVAPALATAVDAEHALLGSAVGNTPTA
jgi:hypothetical protein